MRNPLWMAAGYVLSSVLLGAAFSAARREIWLGMVAPLLVGAVTWISTERVHRVHPERLTSMMIRAFAGKLLFFGVYVALVIGGLGAQPIPFILSFTGYFITLHMIEAFYLKRLFLS